VSTDRVWLKLHTHQSLETKCIQRGSPYRVVVAIGGIRSGKSLCIARWILDRGQWDTAQMHGLFANTKGQLDTIMQDVTPWIEAAGIDWQAHRQPPKDWIESWRLRGIKVPPRRTSYRGIFIASSGFHAQLGSLENRSYQKIKGARWGSLIVEEVCAGATEDAIRYLFERVNCNLGPQRCAELHHHVKILHANPPDDDGHWIYDWLARRERLAATRAGIASSERNDTYPCLLRGIGETIYIPSRTIDNAGNLPAEFIGDMLNTVDDDTADKVLRGVLKRKRKGRVYNAFSYENQIDTITCDPKRPLYVSIDFNKNPAVALFAQPLRDAEVPEDYRVPGITHIGVFGEVFHVGGLDVNGLCQLILNGEAGSDGSLPPEFKGAARHEGPVKFFGDATGAFEKMLGSEWAVVDEVCGAALRGRYSKNIDGKENPLVPVGVHAVNAKFRSASGLRSLWIHPRCSHLIEDMLINSWHRTDPNKIYKPGVRGGRDLQLTTHLGDALRYLISTLFPLGREIDVGSALSAIPVAPPRTFKGPQMR
jgi:hypothetical protein